MAFDKMLPHRPFRVSRFAKAAVTNCFSFSPCVAAQSRAPNHPMAPNGLAPDPGESSVFRRFLHKKSSSVAVTAVASDLRFLPTGEKLLEKLRGLDIDRQRIRLDSLRPPTAAEVGEKVSPPEGAVKVTVKEAVKILRLSQLETLKLRLRQIEKNCISYPEFVEICAKDSSNIDQGLEFAKILDQSGSVIVIGNIVFLKPQQVVKAIQGLIPLPTPPPPPSLDDPRTQELLELEKRKLEIDTNARSLVQRELWCGLGYLIVQTVAFMRLTFWELSWDVMEPICFYVTSFYFMGGYAFFLRTSKEPSFEGFFQSRFAAKQKKLMKAEGFDVERYNELKKACSYGVSKETENNVSFRFSSSSLAVVQ